MEDYDIQYNGGGAVIRTHIKQGVNERYFDYFPNYILNTILVNSDYSEKTVFHKLVECEISEYFVLAIDEFLYRSIPIEHISLHNNRFTISCGYVTNPNEKLDYGVHDFLGGMITIAVIMEDHNTYINVRGKGEGFSAFKDSSSTLSLFNETMKTLIK